jgi:Ca2+-binding EF-hand superfamily protein
MKKLIITLSTFALALSAIADEKKDKKPVKKLPPAMAKFDKNKDGKLCPKERAEVKKAFLAKYDKNKDGKLCKKERKAVAADRAKAAKARKARKLPKGSKGKVQK